MAQTQNRPAGNGAAAEQVMSATGSSVPRAWHEQADWEAAHQYAAGWADGYAAGWQAVADEVARAIGVRPYTARAVIRDLIRSMDRPPRPEPYSSPENGTTLGVAERDVIGRWAA